MVFILKAFKIMCISYVIHSTDRHLFAKGSHFTQSAIQRKVVHAVYADCRQQYYSFECINITINYRKSGRGLKGRIKRARYSQYLFCPESVFIYDLAHWKILIRNWFVWELIWKLIFFHFYKCYSQRVKVRCLTDFFKKDQFFLKRIDSFR